MGETKKPEGRVVYFDFDCTLSVIHVWKTLAGFEDRDAPRSQRMPPRCGPPNFIEERGQMFRLVELGRPWSFEVMGGEARLSCVRLLFRRLLAEPGVRLAVLSKGNVGPIRKILSDVDLLKYFDRVIGSNYGVGNCRDLRLPSWAEEMLASPGDFLEMVSDAKLATMNRDMTENRNLELCQAILIDDDPEEVALAEEYVETIHVKQRGGFGHKEALELFDHLGIAAFPFLREERLWQAWPQTRQSIAPAPPGDEGQQALASPDSSQTWNRQGRALKCFAPVMDSKAWLMLRGGDHYRDTLATNAVQNVKLADVIDMIAEARTLRKLTAKYMLTALVERGHCGVTLSAANLRMENRVIKRVSSYRYDEIVRLRRSKANQFLHPQDFFVNNGVLIVATVDVHPVGGDLTWAVARLIEGTGGLSMQWIARVLRPVADGLSFLHNAIGCGHGSVRPENVLFLSKPVSAKEAPDIRIADFGTSKRRIRRPMTDLPCTFIAPEVKRPEDVSPAADVWAFGMMMYMLLNGRLQGTLNTFEKIVDTLRYIFSGKESRAASELLAELLRPEPRLRPEFRSVLVHPFLKFNGARTGKIMLPCEVIQQHLARDQARSLKLRFLKLIEDRAAKLCTAMKARFDEVDADGDGVISMEEFEEYWDGVVFPKGNWKPSAKALMCILDASEAGSVKAEQLAHFHFSLRALDKSDMLRFLRAVFVSLVGPDENGLLSPKTLENLFTKEHPAVVQALFEEVDPDGTGTVAFEGFADFVVQGLGLQVGGPPP